MTSRSPGNAAETAARRSAAYGAASACAGLAVDRGAQSAATKARNSSVVGRPRFSALCCSSLTLTSCHDVIRVDAAALRRRRFCNSDQMGSAGFDSGETLAGRFRSHARGDRSLYGFAMRGMADDWEAGGVVREICAGWEDAPPGSVIQLRLLAGSSVSSCVGRLRSWRSSTSRWVVRPAPKGCGPSCGA